MAQELPEDLMKLGTLREAKAADSSLTQKPLASTSVTRTSRPHSRCWLSGTLTTVASSSVIR